VPQKAALPQHQPIFSDIPSSTLFGNSKKFEEENKSVPNQKQLLLIKDD
jgi:hypothetical protein